MGILKIRTTFLYEVSFRSLIIGMYYIILYDK